MNIFLFIYYTECFPKGFPRMVPMYERINQQEIGTIKYDIWLVFRTARNKEQATNRTNNPFNNTLFSTPFLGGKKITSYHTGSSIAASNFGKKEKINNLKNNDLLIRIEPGWGCHPVSFNKIINPPL